MHRAAHPGSSTDVFTDSVQNRPDTYRLFFFAFLRCFLLNFIPPTLKKSIYSAPAINSCRDPASCTERFNGAGRCPVHPWQKRGAVMDVADWINPASSRCPTRGAPWEGTTFRGRELENNSLPKLKIPRGLGPGLCPEAEVYSPFQT